jgi:chondroitin AC lyase
MEEPYNGPGKTTHHRADGTNYLMLKGDEYHNIWPVYDWQKISGTTILQKPRLPGPDSIQMDGLTDFVGAVTDGLYGAVAFDFISPHDRLEAKKSWFFFDEEYVCLGTDIKSAPDLPVATTINQVLMRGDVTIMEEGEVKTLVSGSHDLKEIKFLHHDNIGYIFPTPRTVQVSNQMEEGRWSDITDQKNISTETVGMNVFKLWINHGNSPDSADYQYIVVPGVNKQELIETSQNQRNIEILASNSDMHAVWHNKLNVGQIIFYQAGTVKLANGLKIKMDSPGMAMLKIKDDRVIELTVSDPFRKSSRLLVTLSGEYNANGDHLVILPNAVQKDSMILIDLPQDVYAGKSVTISLESK